jgi:hypothetical protein
MPVKMVEYTGGTTITLVDMLRTLRNERLRRKLSTTHLEALLRNDHCLHDELLCRVHARGPWERPQDKARWERRCRDIDNYWLWMLTVRDVRAAKCLGLIVDLAPTGT